MTIQATDEQVSALQQEAAHAGDQKMVAKCERALNGSARARTEISKYLAGVRMERVMNQMRSAV